MLQIIMHFDLITTRTVGDKQFLTTCSNGYHFLLKSVGIEEQH